MSPTPSAVRGANRRNRLLAALLVTVIAVAGCKSNKEQAAAPTAPGAGLPGAVVTQTSWAPDVLEQLLAPIALYPDELIGQILAASVNSQEVLDAGNWLLQNQNLKGDALDAAAKKAGFGDPMRALLRFPTVLDMMCQEFDWTRQLGAAFTSDQRGVLDAIQRLRASAVDVGSLQSNPQQIVEKTTDNGTQVILVKPADPTVIYVPQYNPQVVYTTPPATTTQSTSSGSSTTSALVAFTLGIVVGSAMSNNYCYPHYGAGCVYVGPHPYYPPAYAYHPAYPPAHGYYPPPGYPHSYNQQNNVNINVNNNYYNQFNNNSNLKGGAANSPIARPKATNTKAGGQTAWKGQSGYAGAKPKTPTAQPRTAGTAGAGGKSSPSVSGGAQPSRTSQPDRGYGGSSDRAQTSSGAGGASARPTTQPSPSAAAPKADNAFSGASQKSSGSFDQAASARGQASTSGSSAAARTSSSGSRSGGGRGR